MVLKLGDILLLIGKRIKELRIKHNMTQTELGEKLNLTKVSISCYENNTRIPSLETLYKISEIFSVDISYLAGRERYIINEELNDYAPVSMAKEEIDLVKELRNHSTLYNFMIEDPKRTIELIRKKLDK